MAEYNRSIVQAPAAPVARTLIRGATVLSMDGDIGNLARGDILIEGSTITAIGENIEAGSESVCAAWIKLPASATRTKTCIA